MFLSRVLSAIGACSTINLSTHTLNAFKGHLTASAWVANPKSTQFEVYPTQCNILQQIFFIAEKNSLVLSSHSRNVSTIFSISLPVLLGHKRKVFWEEANFIFKSDNCQCPMLLRYNLSFCLSQWMSSRILFCLCIYDISIIIWFYQKLVFYYSWWFNWCTGIKGLDLFLYFTVVCHAVTFDANVLSCGSYIFNPLMCISTICCVYSFLSWKYASHLLWDTKILKTRERQLGKAIVFQIFQI